MKPLIESLRLLEIRARLAGMPKAQEESRQRALAVSGVERVTALAVADVLTLFAETYRADCTLLLMAVEASAAQIATLEELVTELRRQRQPTYLVDKQHVRG